MDPRSTSRYYGYTGPAPRRVRRQAAQQWDGPTGDHNNVVDLVQGPAGPEARAIAALAEQNLPACAKRPPAAAAHPCPAIPANRPGGHGRRGSRPAAITDGYVGRQPGNLCSRRRQIIGREDLLRMRLSPAGVLPLVFTVALTLPTPGSLAPSMVCLARRSAGYASGAGARTASPAR